MNQNSWTDLWFRFAGDDEVEYDSVAQEDKKNVKAETNQEQNPSEPSFSSTNVRAESLISEALQQLSIEERERVTFEVHGVADETEEDPDFVATKLKGLVDELSKLKNKPFLVNAKAFHMAEAQDSTYVYNERFCLDFLRADDYNTKDAANRLIKFFDFKLDMFGESKLCQHVTLNDLEQDEFDILQKGFFQRLPQRDRAGREVIVLFPAMMKYTSYRTMVSIAFISLASTKQIDRNFPRTRKYISQSFSLCLS